MVYLGLYNSKLNWSIPTGFKLSFSVHTTFTFKYSDLHIHKCANKRPGSMGVAHLIFFVATTVLNPMKFRYDYHYIKMSSISNSFLLWTLDIRYCHQPSPHGNWDPQKILSSSNMLAYIKNTLSFYFYFILFYFYSSHFILLSYCTVLSKVPIFSWQKSFFPLLKKVEFIFD